MTKRSVGKDGYVRVVDHEGECGYPGKWVPEHRLVMARFLGFPLPSNAQIHHINGDKSDNRIENLAVVSPAAHSMIHMINPTKVIVQRESYNPEFIGKEAWLKMICPNCGKAFFRRKAQSHLKLKKKYDFDCCSSKCAAVFIQSIEDNGMDAEKQRAIDQNIVCEFKAKGRFMDRFLGRYSRIYDINDEGLLIKRL